MADRITWEYCTIKVQDIREDEKLNQLGAEGWEVYATHFDKDPYYSQHHLKRPTRNYEVLDKLCQNYIWVKEEW